MSCWDEERLEIAIQETKNITYKRLSCNRVIWRLTRARENPPLPKSYIAYAVLAYTATATTIAEGGGVAAMVFGPSSFDDHFASPVKLSG